MNIDDQLRKWIRGTGQWPFLKKTKQNEQIEYEFISQYITPKTRKQWSSSFGERLVESLLISQGYVVSRPAKINGLFADLETEHAFYEVKTRNWSTSGTAGEKILGTPFKYIDFTKYTDKKLYIVLVGYQEFEAKYKFKIFENSERKHTIINLYKSWNIEFVYCSDLLLEESCKASLNERRDAAVRQELDDENTLDDSVLPVRARRRAT